MARINWQGTEIEAELIDQLPNGNYKMRSKGRAPRIEPGTVIEVTQSQIVGLSIGGVNFNGPGAQAQLAGQQSGQTITSVIPPAAPPAPPAAANDAAGAIHAGFTDIEPQTITAADVGPLPAALLAPAAVAPAPGSKPMGSTPADHFKSLVSTLRMDVRDAVAKAKALKVRGPASLAAFGVSHKALSDVYDEVDAATAEINGALQDGNGQPAGTDVKN